MVLKPQDIFVFLKLVEIASPRWTYVQLAHSLYMSVSEINAAVKRGIQARLVAAPEADDLSPRPIRKALEEFLVHGVKYAFVPEKGEMVRGIPTGYAAAPLSEKMVISSEPPPVWPYAEGKVRGYSFSPLYKSVPKAAENDPALYELLVLVDAIRDGRAREQDLAIKELRVQLRKYKDMYKKNLNEYRKGDQIKMSNIVRKYRSQILSLAKENGVKNVRVFGSMARNEGGPDSDLDLLVDIEKGRSGFALGGFLADVTELVHRKVDVVTESSLHPKIRDKVLHEAKAL